MSGPHIVPFYCISNVYGNKESENCPYSRFFCPYSRISFPYFASTNRAFTVNFLPCRRRRNVFRKNSPCFCHTKPRVMNVWDRPKYHPKCRVACSKKRHLAAYKYRPVQSGISHVKQPEGRCRSVYKRKSLTAWSETWGLHLHENQKKSCHTLCNQRKY